MLIDASTAFGAHVLQRLQSEPVIWLTTTGRDGTPQPNPVWFLWDGATFLIYTQPGSQKVRNLQRSPRVALHFNSTPDGGDVVIFSGQAQLDPAPVPPEQLQAYLEKYRQGLVDINETPESFAANYRTTLRVRPDRLRGF